MKIDINKAQISALGIFYKEKTMEKQEVLSKLRKTRTISTEMLPIIGMTFDIFLRYAQLDKNKQQRIVDKAIKKLDPDYCDSCECSPCDCGYGS